MRNPASTAPTYPLHMYAQFFGLKQEPFSIAPDPRYLFMSRRHREALAHLLYGLNGGGGFVLLSGEIGAGKTTVCRCFLEQIPKRTNVAYIFNPKLTVNELLKSVCDEFGIAYEPKGPGPAHGQGLSRPAERFPAEDPRDRPEQRPSHCRQVHFRQHAEHDPHVRLQANHLAVVALLGDTGAGQPEAQHAAADDLVADAAIGTDAAV